jgi:glycosyltransferase involved in cell wall biosynthesis
MTQRAEQDDLLSVVVAFFNEEQFLDAAVASVYAQTHRHWELLLVDDGSSDRSAEIARGYAARDPARVKYLCHPDHENRGASATRNLGVDAARGEWVAFLDGDDVWMPTRLARGIALAREHPDADMVYGRTQYWYSWQPDAASRDYVQPLHLRANRLVRPPELLVRYLTLRASWPGMSSLFVRRSAYQAVGGFEAQFRGLVDDAVFVGKFCLRHAVYVSGECWDRYRQHAASDTTVAEAEGRMRAAHRSFLVWFDAYVGREGGRFAEVRAAIAVAIRRMDRAPHHWRARLERLWRRAAQWRFQY